MADSTQVRSALQVFLQRRIAQRVKNTLFNKMPWLDFMFSLNGNKKDADGLGRPVGGGLAVGRINEVGRPQLEKMMREREYLITVQTTKPSSADAKRMADYDNDPMVLNWDTTNAPGKRFKQPRARFARLKMPYVIPHTDLKTVKRNAGNEGGQAAAAVGSVYDVEIKSREAALCELLNADLFNTAALGAPADEDALQWDRFHSMLAALSETNTYCGVDRSLAANAWWRGNTNTAQFTGSFEAMIETCNYDELLIAKGLTCQIIIVGKDLMRKAKAEARSAGYTMVSPKVPEATYGFTKEMVVIYSGNRPVYIIYDPQMDVLDAVLTTKAAFCLDPTTWTVAIAPDGNFKISEPSDQTKISGGAEIDTGTIQTELLLVCEVPSGNVVFTDVAL